MSSLPRIVESLTLLILPTTALAQTAESGGPVLQSDAEAADPGAISGNEPEGTPVEPGDSESAPPATTLTLDLGAGSAYVWRGINLWGADTDSQNLSLFPSVTLASGSWTAFYWGGHQLSGDTKGSNVDAAVGAEQDLGVTYALPLREELTLSLWGTALLWPLADKAVTGTSLPASFEPGVTIVDTSLVTLSLGVSYFRGLVDATDAFSHVYVAPSVGKDLPITNDLVANLSISGGYKFWTNKDTRDAGPINHWDVGGHLGATYSVGALYAKPALHVSKSDIDDAANGLAYWGTLSIGYILAL